MLELALDKGFLESFSVAYRVGNEYADDFVLYFLRNLNRFKLMCNFRNMDELMAEASKNPVLELIVERIPKVEFIADFESLVGSSEFTSSGSPLKLVLSGQDAATCTKRRSSQGIEHLCPNNIHERWALYYSRRTDINKKTTADTEIPEEFRFDSWNQFKPFIHPLNAIILVDFYLLSWEREDDFRNTLNYNIIPLLDNLLSDASADVPVEISFVSEFKDKPPITQSYRVNKTKQLIDEAIGKITSKTCKINLIVHNKQNYSKDFQEFHDRIIITNYFYINCGAGFNIGSKKAGIGVFEKPGKLSRIRHNSEIQFRSILNIQNYWTAFKDLKQLDMYCKKLENHAGLPDYLNYLPDKTNRLLKVEHE